MDDWILVFTCESWIGFHRINSSIDIRFANFLTFNTLRVGKYITHRRGEIVYTSNFLGKSLTLKTRNKGV